MALHIPPSLRHKKFLYLWLGQLISITGTQMQLWALFWHINQLNKNPIALGGIAVISGGIGCILGIIFIIWKWPHLVKYNGDEPMLAGATTD